MIVGEVKAKSKKPFEVVFETGTTNEAFHMKIDLANDVIQRWNIFDNITSEILGQPFEGTTIDRDEPFMLRYELKYLCHHFQHDY